MKSSEAQKLEIVRRGDVEEFIDRKVADGRRTDSVRGDLTTLRSDGLH
jgi:hypothetical protein